MSDAYERFTTELTAAEADLILSDLTFEGIKAIIGQDDGRDHHGSDVGRYFQQAPSSLSCRAAGGDCAQRQRQSASTRLHYPRSNTLDPTIHHVTGAAKNF